MHVHAMNQTSLLDASFEKEPWYTIQCYCVEHVVSKSLKLSVPLNLDPCTRLILSANLNTDILTIGIGNGSSAFGSVAYLSIPV